LAGRAGLRFSGGQVVIDSPRPLFESRIPDGPTLRYSYDVSRDGQRFLLVNPVSERATKSLSVLFNWQEALKP